LALSRHGQFPIAVVITLCMLACDQSTKRGATGIIVNRSQFSEFKRFISFDR